MKNSASRSEQPIFTPTPAGRRISAGENELGPSWRRSGLQPGFPGHGGSQDLMADPEMRELCQETFLKAKTDQENLYRELQVLLLPKDPNDARTSSWKFVGGVGGEESALFAHSLFRMYAMYAAALGWKIELMNYNETELGGVKGGGLL